MSRTKKENSELGSLQESLVKKINQGKKSVIAFDVGKDDDLASLVGGWASTGCWLLDHIITNKPDVGGFPLGRVVDVSGEFSSGKSLLTGALIAEAQAKGGFGILVDTELSLDKHFLGDILKIDFSRLVVVQTKIMEDAFEAIFTAVQGIREIYAEAPIVVVIDSCAGLKTVRWTEMDLTNDFNAVQMYEAKKLSMLLDRAVQIFADSKACLVCIGQARDVVNTMNSWGPKKRSTSGNTLKHYTSVQVWLKKTKTIQKPKKDPDGIWIEAKVNKNNVAPPYKKIWFPVYFNRGIDNALAELYYLEDKALVRKTGANIKIKLGEEEFAIQTKEWLAFYAEHKEAIRALILEELISRPAESNAEVDMGEEEAQQGEEEVADAE